MASRYDAIIIGAGHNGLVAACYLARAGWKVLVLERRHLVGGACVTEEVFPGFKVSTAAYVISLFRPEIVRDLRLDAYGLRVLERIPSSFTPFPNGRFLLLGTDPDLDQREIAKFSVRDADTYPRYQDWLEGLAAVLEPLLTVTPPNVCRPGPRDLWRLLKLGRMLTRTGARLGDLVELLTGAARPILDRWFESEELKATLATDAVIGAMASPSTPGTAYVLFHHVMGETNGKRGIWGYVQGGMGALTQALAQAARGLSVTIRCEAEVSRILVKDGKAAGVALANGDEFKAPVVASNADAHVTFTRLLDPKRLPEDFVQAVQRIDYRSASLKINLAPVRTPELPRLSRHGAGSAASGNDSHLPRSRLPRAGLRRRQVRPSIRPPDSRVHDSLGGRSLRRPAGLPPDVDVRPVCAVSPARGHVGSPAGALCGSLCGSVDRVCAELQGSHHRPADLDTPRY
ncbi:MAG: hypothetical protein KatS3mg082_1317 [Nitrospiraceae bacterium]|nr:MAG: hypothetical protein KatS3mg082_1317 [Nitrospiraceae bacterium]